MSLNVHKLTSRVGAVVEGADLTGPADADRTEQLRRLLETHKALVFTGVDLDDAAQERVASWFGPLTTAHPNVPGTGSANILAVDSATSKANEWHSDVTFVTSPPSVTTLRSIVTTPYGGETLIANASAAYADLPNSLRQLAEGLWAVHSNEFDYARPPARTEGQREYDRAFVSTVYETLHPVVRHDQRSGQRGLFIGGFARHIEGLSASESSALLRIFQSYVIRPENLVRWRWSPRELVIFDNRFTQHYAVDNYDDLPRRLSRVTVAGDVPTSVAGERSVGLRGDAAHYTPKEVSAA